MSRHRDIWHTYRNNWTRGGLTFLILGLILLVLNTVEAFEGVSATGADLFAVFFDTTGEDGLTSLVRSAVVWGPFAMIPLGLILYFVGTRKPENKRERVGEVVREFNHDSGL